MAYFEAFDNMVFEGNYVGEAPGLTTYPDLNSVMMENITQIRLGNSTAPTYRWDPGREEDCFVCNVWPLPENFSYTNATLSAGGTDGLPVGDLNWYPDAKADYETNKAGYLSELESKAEGVALISVVITEGEEGTLNDDASIYAPDGFSSFFMQGSGFIEWTFDLETAGTYGLNLQTNMRSETQRGQRVFMNGVNLRNNEGFGEYYFCTTAIEGCANPLPNNEWTLVEIRDGGLFEGADALTLEAGTHIVRVEPSWGWQGFSGMEIVDGAGNPVASATAVEATYEGVIPECEEGQYCPQGFKAATLEAGGSVSWTVDAPGTGDYLVRVFYQTPNGPTNGSLLLNGETVFGSLFFNGEAGDLETLDLFTDRFAMTQGSNTITIMSDQGGLNVDYVQVLSFGATGTSNERAELPDGYELEQNYPNPFNPTTTIAFSLGNADQVTLTVYDVLGRRVHTLVDGNLPSGRHQFTWQGRDAAGSLAASGVYFYRLETSVGTQVRSMLLVK
ncbi:MAG: CBM35 domain-containing protein [Bacteroidota bacterium]